MNPLSSSRLSEHTSERQKGTNNYEGKEAVIEIYRFKQFALAYYTFEGKSYALGCISEDKLLWVIGVGAFTVDPDTGELTPTELPV